MAWVSAPETDDAPAELIIRPNTPLNGVSTGQTAVVYVGTRVLGQCTIDRTVSAVPVPA
jgi:tRNA-specific 2-thiouridylase